MALQSTTRGPYGVITTPTGDVYTTPEQAAMYGVPPPAIDDLSLGAPPLAPPPVEAEAPILPPPSTDGTPPGGTISPPPAYPTPKGPPGYLPEVTGNPFSRAPAGGFDAAPDSAPAPTEAPASDTPPPRERTNLSGVTTGDVYDAKTDALDQSARAAANLSAAEVANNDEKAAAIVARNVAQDAADEADAKARVEEQARVDGITAKMSNAVDEFAKAKVDRSNYRISPMQWIGVAISGFGAAKSGQNTNPALDLLLKQIDQYVEDEYRKKDALKQNIGAYKDQLDTVRTSVSDARASRAVFKVGLMEKAARDAEAMIPKMENKTAAARLGLEVAALRGKQAEVFGEGVAAQSALDQQIANREQQERESRRAAGAAAARLREDARQFDLTYEQREQERAASKNAAVASATNALDAENAKREVADLKMAAVGPDGKPTAATYRAKNEKLGDEVAQMHASVKTLDSLMAEAERIRASYPTFGALKKSPEYQKLMANVSAAGIAWAKANQMGAWDNGTATAVLGAQGGDPMRAGYLSDTIGRYLQGDPKVGLEQFRKNTVGKFNDFAASVRDPRGGDYVPIEPAIAIYDKPDRSKIDGQLDAIRNAKTPDEIRTASARGWSTRLPGDRADVAESKARAAADPKDSTGGLSKVQGDGIRDLALVATTGKNANGTTQDKASALGALEGLATEYAKKPAVAQRALETLVEIGDEAAIARVEAALVAAAPKTEEDKGVERTAIRTARENVASRAAANNFQAPPSIDALAAAAGGGDRQAAATLADMASGRQKLNGPPITADQRLRANAAILALGKKRGAK